MAKRIGIVTGGGDCPGLNTVIRAVAKAATMRGPMLTTDFKQMVFDYIERRFGIGAKAAE